VSIRLSSRCQCAWFLTDHRNTSKRHSCRVPLFLDSHNHLVWGINQPMLCLRQNYAKTEETLHIISPWNFVKGCSKNIYSQLTPPQRSFGREPLLHTQCFIGHLVNAPLGYQHNRQVHIQIQILPWITSNHYSVCIIYLLGGVGRLTRTVILNYISLSLPFISPFCLGQICIRIVLWF
jgi:hypothetical protein